MHHYKYTELDIPSNIDLYGDKTLILAWTPQPIAFLITSNEVTETFKQLFYKLWKKAEK